MPKRKSNKSIHNTHLLMPEKLWQALKKKAKEVGCTVTDLVVQALELFLVKKEK